MWTNFIGHTDQQLIVRHPPSNEQWRVYVNSKGTVRLPGKPPPCAGRRDP